MSINIGDFLICPDCQGNLAIGGKIICQECRRIFPIEDGILLLLPSRKFDEPKFYDDPTYQKYIKGLEIIHANHYKKGSLTGRVEENIKENMARLFVANSPPIVDLGCGGGNAFSYLGAQEDIIGVDNNLTLLRRGRERYPDAHLICCDMRLPPFRPGCFRTLYSVATLEHIFYLESFLEATERCLAPGGYFYVAVPTEGGMLWNLCRSLWTARRNSKLLDLNYSRAISKDHCNTVFTIHNNLNKFFAIETFELYPFRFGGFHTNLAVLYRLRKRV